MLSESLLEANMHWISRTAEVSDLDLAKESFSNVNEEINFVQTKLTELLEIELERYVINDFESIRDGIEFSYELISQTKPTGKYLKFTITYSPPRTYVIAEIIDEVNGKIDRGITTPHVLGSSFPRTDGNNLV